jgi:CRISPR-associated protein Csd2
MMEHATTTHQDPAQRHDFVLLFDVADGNPNGDPDFDNQPRTDLSTQQGLVTDVCLKRKIRNYIDLVRGTEERFKIYIQSGTALNDLHARAYTDLHIKSKGAKQDREDVEKTRQWMCRNFWDIRMFGAMMATEVACGQVRGPLQLTFARSIDPIQTMDIAITRIAITKPQDMKVVVAEDGKGAGGKVTEMGRKAIVPYGLYRAHGFFNPMLARQTGVDKEDLDLFWTAVQQMFEFDRSAARGLMAVRGLYAFSHEKELGNAHAHQLFERVRVERRAGVEAPRSFSDYMVTVETDDLPQGVQLTGLVDFANETASAANVAVAKTDGVPSRLNA